MNKERKVTLMICFPGYMLLSVLLQINIVLKYEHSGAYLLI